MFVLSVTIRRLKMSNYGLSSPSVERHALFGAPPTLPESAGHCDFLLRNKWR